jgi:hypothetical protein
VVAADNVPRIGASDARGATDAITIDAARVGQCSCGSSSPARHRSSTVCSLSVAASQPADNDCAGV